MVNFYKQTFALFFLCSYFIPVFANQTPWLVILNIGYGKYKNMFHDDGRYALLKLGFGKSLLFQSKNQVGIELGVENGNNMRLDVPKPILNQLGGLPFQSTMKSLVDLLASVNLSINKSNVFTVFKGGVALRTWQFERCSADDRTKLNPEVQIGLGYRYSEAVSTHLLYRMIVGNKLSYSINTDSEELTISGMPTQMGVMLGTSISFDGF